MVSRLVEFAVVCSTLSIAARVNSGGLSLTSEQVVIQLQQDVITLKAQVADQIQFGKTLRVSSSWRTFQKAYLEEWEQEHFDSSHIHGQESKNIHRSRSFSRTGESESL